jgi:hypothetical protein
MKRTVFIVTTLLVTAGLSYLMFLSLNQAGVIFRFTDDFGDFEHELFYRQTILISLLIWAITAQIILKKLHREKL